METVQHERGLDAVALRRRRGRASRGRSPPTRRTTCRSGVHGSRARRASRTTVLWNTGRAEERAPAELRGAGVVQVQLAGLAVLLDVEHTRSHEPELGAGVEQLQGALEPVGKGRIVRVHACDVAAASLVEGAVQRSSQTELLVVAKHTQTRICRAPRGCRPCRRRSSRRRRSARGRSRSGAEGSGAPFERTARRRARRRERRRAERSAQASRSLRPVQRELPSFDLVVATVGRTDELARFLDSLAAQDYPRTRVLLVDQNEDARLDAVIASAPVEVVHLRSARGLSRARNVALTRVDADVVAFPDDDCVYPAGAPAARRRAARGDAGARWPHRSGRGLRRKRRRRHGAPTGRSSVATTSGTARSRSRSSSAAQTVTGVGDFDVAARPRLGHALALGRGDRLPRPRARPRSADRIRPCARRPPRRADGHTRDRTARRRQHRLPPAQARVPGAHRRSDARQARRRRSRGARPSRHGDAPATSSRRFAAACAAISGRGARRSRRDARATARARSARRPEPEQQPSSAGGRRGRGRPRRRARPARAARRDPRSRDEVRRYPPRRPTSSTRASARRVHDREPACHRLDDEGRARILDLRVQEQMRAPEDRRRVALVVLPEQVDAALQAELVDAAASTSLTSRPVTRSCASGWLGVSAASVRSASSSRYACVWSPPRRSTGPPDGGASAGVKRSTSTAFGRISHEASGSPRKRDAESRENSL